MPGHPINKAMVFGFENVYGPFMGCPGTILRVLVGGGEFCAGGGILLGVWIDALGLGGGPFCDGIKALLIVAATGLMCAAFSAGAMHIYVDKSPAKYSLPSSSRPPMFPSFFGGIPPSSRPPMFSTSMFSSSPLPATATSTSRVAAQPDTRSCSAEPKVVAFKTDLERLDAHLDAIHTEEFLDVAIGNNMSARELREYFTEAGIDSDSDGRKFVEVSDMRTAYVRRATLGVVELRRRLKARGISCEAFVERKDFEEAFAQASRACPICIDDYKVGDCVCALPCGHTYHLACVRQAAHTELEMHQRWPRCPECRNEFNRTPGRLSSGERPAKGRRC